MAEAAPPPLQPKERLPRNVRLLGLASLLNDIASEAVFPLIPKFVEEVLKGNLKQLGLIEGAADSVASLLKLAAGGWSDWLGRRKPFILVGYALGAVARPAIGLAAAPWHVLASRTGDRFGKGLRTAARDAMIVESVGPNQRGEAFGFRQAMDHVGATLGPLLALAFLWFLPGKYRWLFLLTIVPGVVVIAALLLVKETTAHAEERPRFRLTLAPFDWPFRRFLFVLAVFTLACSSDAFLLAWAGRLGAPTWQLLLFWSLFSAAKAAGNLWVGKRVDRHGAWRFILAGWLLYAVCYAAFAMATEAWHVWAVMLPYALYYAMTEPAEKTLVAELAGPANKGLAFGWFHATLGIMTLPASFLFGAVADAFGKEEGLRWAFGLAAGMALLATLLFLLFVRSEPAGRPA